MDSSLERAVLSSCATDNPVLLRKAIYRA
jgi:hypothetical protein